MAQPALEPIDLLYRTIMTRERSGPYGWLMRHVAAHPILSGLIGGAIAVLIALWRGWKGVQTMPEAAAVLCGLVILVWCVLFFFMRGFFRQQIMEQVEVVRRIQLTAEEGFVWTQGTTILCEASAPSWRLCRPLAMKEERVASEEHPSTVWLVMTSADDPAPRLEREVLFVLETKVMWREARHYPMESHEPDESLPTHVASPLLELGRAQMHS